MSNETRLQEVRKRTRRKRNELVFVYKDGDGYYFNYGYSDEHQLTKAEIDELNNDESKTVILVEYLDVF